MSSPTAAVPLSTLTLRVANREQTIESRKRSYHEWGRGMTLEKYLERDEKTEQHEIAKNGRLVTWVLVHRESPEGLDFLCACETYVFMLMMFKREGAVFRKGDTGIRDVACYGIASVFTPVENRKKGYAAHMMRLLHWVLGPRSSLPEQFPVQWGAPPERRDSDLVGDAAFSVLYSDIGPNFYRLAGSADNQDDGWVVHSPRSTVLKVDDVQAPDAKYSVNEDQWKWLDEDGLAKIWEKDTEIMKSELVKYPLAQGQDIACTFFPRGGVADFQIQRLQEWWKNVNPIPRYWGLQISSPDGSPDLSTFAAWTIEYRPPKLNTLLIIRIRASPSTFADLLRCVCEYAKQHSIERVEMWNLEAQLVEIAEGLGAQTFDRNDHLCSLKWYGPYTSDEASRVVWAFNEK
ncbi:hypothetical protein CVT24_005633 [Panaeolus cyanescens]|uniref:LYC1 C-terminal domain-containing protein n=1 Tax=Panaeolus cyanescens TaxID=181874 RepID=A0A409V9I4_9AGAR|nr:hypothetical protein CVT24_005633 [Panaeolus cyanescens]